MRDLDIKKMAAIVTGKTTKKCDQDTNNAGILQTKTKVSNQQTRFGQLPSFSSQRIWARSVIVACATVIVYWSARNEKINIFASQRDFIEKKTQNVPCSASYQSEISRFNACAPKQCGRFVTDNLITKEEAEALLTIAKNGLALGGSDGGASILDLHSGALSHGQNFVNFYKLPESVNAFTAQDFITYKIVKNKIHREISSHFGINADSLYLTQPTFFSRLTNAPPKMIHDEYWQVHVDKETYNSFHYTSLLYLSDFSRDFFGGRFVFIDPHNKSTVIEPRKGRVSTFTSGAENPHYVEKVTSGTRYAITVSFTCDQKQAINDPHFRQLHLKL